MNADTTYTAYAAHLWHRIAAYWSLGTITRYWPNEVGE